MKFLYHANCTDGAGAALAAWLKHGDKGKEYIPVQYVSEPPDGLDDEEVALLDFSYPRQTILDLSAKVESLLIIDHHKTAEKELMDIKRESGCPVIMIFDMTKSGAVLAWEHFHPDTPAPSLLLTIQDRDLWQFRLPHTQEITKALQCYPDWRTWATFLGGGESIITLIEAGKAIIGYLDMQSYKITETGPSVWHITGDEVPVYNLPGFMLSDTLHLALEKYPDCPYAVGYFDLPDKTVYSLRSRSGSDVDVSEIAKAHGGGGHKHAAGFTDNGPWV